MVCPQDRSQRPQALEPGGENAWVFPKTPSKLHDRIKRQTHLSSLHLAHVRAMYSSKFSELFLGHPLI